MKKLKYSVGIDMSKNDFKACLSVIDESQRVTVKSSRTFPNSQTGFSELLKWVTKYHEKEIPIFFLVEATGVYHEQLAWFLYIKGMSISVILANRAKRYLQSLGVKSKNDKIDAKGLAQMCAEKSLASWSPISKNIYQLRALTRLHEDLQNQRTTLINQLHATIHGMQQIKEVKKSLQRMSSAIDREIAMIESKIKKLIEEDEILKSKYEKITAIKGIGLMSFSVIVAETNGFELFKNKAQLVSYAGYDIVENQSGQRSGLTRMSKKGNAHIRRVLHMPAFNAVKYDPSFKAFYDRVYENSRFKMKAYVAVQKKLLCIIYSLWKSDQAYDPGYQCNKIDHSNREQSIIKKPSRMTLA